MPAPLSRARKSVLVAVGVLLVVAGIAGFSVFNSTAADAGCAAAIVGGLGVIRYATRPARHQVV